MLLYIFNTGLLHKWYSNACLHSASCWDAHSARASDTLIMMLGTVEAAWVGRAVARMAVMARGALAVPGVAVIKS